jgi:hypothetical protein
MYDTLLFLLSLHSNIPEANYTKLLLHHSFTTVIQAIMPHTDSQLVERTGGGKFALLQGADGHTATPVQGDHFGFHLVPGVNIFENIRPNCRGGGGG